jgi:threo-3-hydroxy-L-aspartate ammonia-lyase
VLTYRRGGFQGPEATGTREPTHEPNSCRWRDDLSGLPSPRRHCAAAAAAAGVAHRTPVLRSRTADERTGAQLFFKCENFQRMGAFKFRGAYNALARSRPSSGAPASSPSRSGNHAQAIALSARLLGMPSVIVMPHDAPRPSWRPRAATRRASRQRGGAVRPLHRRPRGHRPAPGAERGMTLIPPYDHPHVMAGQGTAAPSCSRRPGPLDLLLVCVGGGGLISGCAVAAHAPAPASRCMGVEPEAGNDTQQSLALGRIVHIDTPKTIADGAQTQHSGQLTFPVIQRLVQRIVTVSDAQLVRTMRFFAERMKLVVEPTGCLAAAAALEGVVPTCAAPRGRGRQRRQRRPGALRGLLACEPRPRCTPVSTSSPAAAWPPPRADANQVADHSPSP